MGHRLDARAAVEDDTHRVLVVEISYYPTIEKTINYMIKCLGLSIEEGRKDG